MLYCIRLPLAHDLHCVYTRTVRQEESTHNQDKRFLIAGLHPTLLGKPVIWFEKNKKEILRSRFLNPFWQKNSVVIEPGIQIKLSVFIRSISDLGYTNVQTLFYPGEFSLSGETIRIFPINTKTPIRIEFFGNTIEAITPIPLSKNPVSNESASKKLPHANGLPFLREGDFLVHVDHGIGIYRGVVEKENGPYLAIEYAKPQGTDAPNDMLYVPEDLMKKVSPYIGFRMPTIHRLGVSLWNTTKRKVKEDIIKFAKELLCLYAKRELAKRPPYEPIPALEQELAVSFPFEETDDQTQAIRDILADMENAGPMDRLLLADVGFGKTEVALRAAFRAILNKKQVALICPTTILAEQHFETFKERLSAFPALVERLTRMETARKQKDILERVRRGAVDIVIGTHRLLSKDVTFHNLGLIIIDEEQRFGVRQKEHLKQMRADADVLSLSATPLPRTLHLALSRLRSLSKITTAPLLRHAPKTFILPHNKECIKKALEAEFERNGQVYYLSNTIHKLHLVKESLQKLVPGVHIETIHGRMNEKDILRVMHNFRNGSIHMLVATTIIENGLDISNANTLIVEDATRVGLAQAHQLRGRIGRGVVQSYAYFLHPAKRSLPENSAKRLDALFKSQYLGSGQEIALHDLEIRGSGNILGRDQAGHINQIGLNLYCQMLAEATEEVRNIKHAA